MVGVQPGTDRWSELVQIGHKAMGSNWAIGDAALEIAPMGDGNGNNGAMANLAVYAEEIGAEFNTVRECRRVSDAWPLANRLASIPWTVHMVLSSPENRSKIRDGMTVREARAAVKSPIPESNVQRIIRLEAEADRIHEMVDQKRLMADGLRWREANATQQKNKE